jgi:hypothetical protein
MSIDELLKLTPEQLSKISDIELDTILKPYYAIARIALLPDSTPQKLGLSERMLQDVLRTNAAEIAKFRAARDAATTKTKT